MFFLRDNYFIDDCRHCKRSRPRTMLVESSNNSLITPIGDTIMAMKKVAKKAVKKVAKKAVVKKVAKKAVKKVAKKK